MYPRILWPIDKDIFESFSKTSKKILIPESNYSGQLASLLRDKTHIRPVSFCVYRGEPILPKEIEDFVRFVIDENIEEARITTEDIYGKKSVGLI